jgi:ribosome-binding protein aMBF1 (putative translation factor)
MITGPQIRAARKLLGWEPFQLAQRAKLHSAIVQRAESGAPPITKYQEALIRNALENAGVEFTNGDEPGVKLKATKERKGARLGDLENTRACLKAVTAGGSSDRHGPCLRSGPLETSCR